MNKTILDLYNICLKKNIKEWNEIRDYAYAFVKYDDITYRDIDKVHEKLNPKERFILNDGGRKEAGYKGDTGDCVTRSIAIASGKSYNEIYDWMFAGKKWYSENHRNKVAKRYQAKGCSPRDGVNREVYEKYLFANGWKWQPTMGIGTGCTTHLIKEELPKGNIIVRVSKHMVAVIDGVIHDTHDPARNGTRCVYGYYYKEV